MSTPAKRQMMFIEIGCKRYEVASFARASAMFCAARDASGLGASAVPGADIVDEHGTFVARISYNGRIWADRDGDRLLCEAGS